MFGKTLEQALQALVEKFPDVIPGSQIDPTAENPPRFCLLRREMPVGSWSLDHLFVDQYGILTLVETKLIQNPEARREVIGQIMDYAANAAALWGQGRVRDRAEEYWHSRQKSVAEALATAFDAELDVEAFWQLVESNLEQGRIRLLVVGDELSSEVKRVIEYLNSEMSRAEIYGLEL